MNAASQYQKLVGMVQEAEREPVPRTIEQEDRIAMEVMILELEGPSALARYQYRWAAGVW